MSGLKSPPGNYEICLPRRHLVVVNDKTYIYFQIRLGSLLSLTLFFGISTPKQRYNPIIISNYMNEDKDQKK